MRFAFAIVLAAAATASAQPSQVTFTKDVAPIFQKSCQNCHRPGSIAPMSLLTYEDARPWARSIKQRVDRAADAAVAHRPHRRHPAVQERSVADARGDRDDRRVGRRRRAARQCRRHAAAAPVRRRGPLAHRQARSDRHVAEGVYGQPEAADWWGSFDADTGLTEDRYIKAIESKPSRRAPRRASRRRALVDDDGTRAGGGTLDEYAVGKNGDVFPEGTGRLMKAGRRSASTCTITRSARRSPIAPIGIVLLPEGRRAEARGHDACWRRTSTTSTSPAAPTTSAATATRIQQAGTLGVQAAHAQARQATVPRADLPGQQDEQLNCVNYDFNWHIVYDYADDVAPL